MKNKLATLAVGLVYAAQSVLPAASASAGNLQVDTTAGSFQGLQTSGGLEAWLGLPFAQPPVGDLRFKAPVPITRPLTQGVQNATEFGHACPQPDADLGATQSEDCLVLNVSLTHHQHQLSPITHCY
jgi:carboxylesterase type B